MNPTTEPPKTPTRLSRLSIVKPPKFEHETSNFEICRQLIEKLVVIVKAISWKETPELSKVPRTRSELLTQCCHICVNVITYRLQQNKCAKPSAMDALEKCRDNNNNRKSPYKLVRDTSLKSLPEIPPPVDEYSLKNDRQTSLCAGNYATSGEPTHSLLSTDDVTSEILRIIKLLDNMFPDVYKNISRKLNTTMKTEDVVSRVLTQIFENLFSDITDVTWAKIVSMMAVAAQIAVECVQQGHSTYVTGVVDSVMAFMSLRLVDWVHTNHGWSGILDAFTKKEESRFSRYLVVAMTTGVLFVAHLISRLMSDKIKD